MRLLEFVRALLKHWWALMSSAVLTIVALYAAQQNETNKWLLSASCAAAVLMFLVAAFLAWNEEHQRLSDSSAKLVEIQSEDREIERRRARAELERLESENRAVAEQRAIAELDNRLLGLIKENLDEMRKQNELHSNIQAYTTEFFVAAAAKLGTSEGAVRDSMQRLKSANRIPGIADLILVSPWARL